MTKAKTGRPKPDAVAPASKPAPSAGMAGSPAARPWRRPERAAARSWPLGLLASWLLGFLAFWFFGFLASWLLRAPVRAARGNRRGSGLGGEVVCAARTGLRTRVRVQAWAPASGGGGLARCRVSAAAPGEIARLPGGPGLARLAGRP